ncbi:MAG: hypothetical protein R3D55_28120 [Chloroflexota bacterium]
MKIKQTLHQPGSPASAHLLRLWWLSLALFVLAGSTGVLMRFGVTTGFPWGLQFSNLRHAHSHLMYFGWVTPALMALISARLPIFVKRPLPPTIPRTIGLTLVFALLAYVPFLLFGYRSAPVAGHNLPLSVMAAGLNVIGWYLFAWQYRRYTRGAGRVLPLRLWDTAVLFMLFASLGGWGLPLLTALRIENPLWSMAFTHLFLDEFAEGWFVLAVLGLLYARQPQASQRPLAQRSHDLMVIGLPVLFILGIPTHLLNTPLRLIGGLGGLLVGLGLWGHVYVLWQSRKSERIPLFFLGLKATALLLIVVPPAARWAEQAGLRISYLHWLLLGFISLSIVATAQAEWASVKGKRLFTAGVIGLILTLLPLTRLWPTVWSGRWVLTAAGWGALLPVLAALVMWGTAVSPQISSHKITNLAISSNKEAFNE